MGDDTVCLYIRHVAGTVAGVDVEVNEVVFGDIGGKEMELEQYNEYITNDEWMRYAHEAGDLKEQCIADWVREVEASLLTEKERSEATCA